MQLGFYFDQSRCTGCYTCQVACKDWHDIPAGPVSWRTMVPIEQGKFPQVSLGYHFHGCQHCASPDCLLACPVNAITKRPEDGIVLVDADLCIGKERCSLCLEACPWGVPQFGETPDAKMEMCTFCVDRWDAGQKPACVESCIMRALDAGPMDELIAKYGNVRAATGFSFAAKTNPSIVFKPR